MIQGPVCVGEIFPWRGSRAFPRALSLQPRSHARVPSPNAASPGPGLRNWPWPSQPDFSWSVEKHVILFSGVQSCLLDEKGRSQEQHWFLFTRPQGDFTPMGWMKQVVLWRQGVVRELLDMLSWLDVFRLRQGKASVLKGVALLGMAAPSWIRSIGSWARCCVIFAADLDRSGPFSTSLLQALAIRKAWPSCCLSDGLGWPLLSHWMFCCSALCILYLGREEYKYQAVVSSRSERWAWFCFCPLEPRDWSSVTCGRLLSLSAAAVVW